MQIVYDRVESGCVVQSSSFPPSARSAPDRAYEWIKQYVSEYPREQGAFLNEGALAAETGTSRTPVREALLRLEAEGLITRIPHKGAYIPAISDSDVASILNARALVEKWAADQFVQNESVLGHLEEILNRQRVQRDDLGTFVAVDTEFHAQMVRSGGNPVLSEFYDSLRERQLRLGIKAINSWPGRVQEVIDEHDHIFSAIKSGDSTRIAAAIETHLESTLRAILSPQRPFRA